jgi:hypothetical protein
MNEGVSQLEERRSHQRVHREAYLLYSFLYVSICLLTEGGNNKKNSCCLN